MKLLAIAMLLFLSACANRQPTPEVWIRSDGGGSQGQLNMDDGQCKAQGFAASMDMVRVATIYNACMQGKGWQRQ